MGTIEYNPQQQGPNTGNLAERVAAAQERLRHGQGDARVAKTVNDDLAFTIGTGEAARIMHDLGMANCVQSLAFIERFLAVERANETLSMRITGHKTSLLEAWSEISALKAEIQDLKRRKGIPPRAETR